MKVSCVFGRKGRFLCKVWVVILMVRLVRWLLLIDLIGIVLLLVLMKKCVLFILCSCWIISG